MEMPFAENFRQCCLESSYCLANVHSKTDEEYAAASRECAELAHAIEARLGEDKKLLDRFDAAKNNHLILGDAYIYQQGFQDCVYLLRWMGAL